MRKPTAWVRDWKVRRSIGRTAGSCRPRPSRPGTVQVAHDGQPIVLLGDCQTIGGYPKIAHVITVDLPRAAQLRPNDTVRFQEVTAAEATALFAEREKDLQRFRIGLALRPA